MTNTYYTSLSGMLAASLGLQTTSHNVSNMQSPGFKRSDVFFSSLSSDRNSVGLGVTVKGQNTNFIAGKYLPTDNPTDLAVVGNGFFIVRLKNGELVYTRDGEFGFNKEGLLIDKHSQGIVQGYDKNKNLVPIRQKGPSKCKGKATQLIELKGDFIASELKQTDDPSPQNPDPLKSKYDPIRFSVGRIFDNQGREHEVTIEMEAPGTMGTGTKAFEDLNWNVLKIECQTAEISFDPQSIEFSSDSNGSAQTGKSSIQFKLNNNQSITLELGTYQNGGDQAVHLSKKSADKTSTSIEIKNQDGYKEGVQIDFKFDENGQINYGYDNGQRINGIFVALAKFENVEQCLTPASDNLFRAKTLKGRLVGCANKEGFGAIQSNKIESANVDSTLEFANIVVLQRMFQACSQIMEIDKQLLEEIYKK